MRENIREFQTWKDTQDGIYSDEDREEGHREEGRDREGGEGQERGEDQEEESDEEIERMKRIQRDVLRFCIDLLDYPLQDNEYESAIISGLAVLGIRDDEGWLDAEDYTPKFSAVIKDRKSVV